MLLEGQEAQYFLMTQLALCCSGWVDFFKCNNFCIIVIFTFTIQNVELVSAHTIDQCHSLGKNQHHYGVLSHPWKGMATQEDMVMNLLQRN